MRATTLLLVLAATGCSEYQVTNKDGENLAGFGEGAPDIEVSPGAIDFGLLSVGESETATQTVTVSNVGDEALQLSDIFVEDASAPYDLGAVSSYLVPVGGTSTFTVTFAPVTANEAPSRVAINSDDPDEPVVYVDLTGIGEAPAIQLTPESYDFGAPDVGCEEFVSVEIRNVGNAELVIDDYSFVPTSDELSFDAAEEVNGPLPWHLDPDEYLEVVVGYMALDEDADSAFFQVSSNDPYTPTAQANQTGAGDPAGLNTDVFEQPLNGASDILFVIDNSSSMTYEQTSLEDNFAYFAAGLDELDVDFHIAMITVEDPTFVGDMLTSDTPNVEAEFIAQASMPLISGVNEMPSQMAYEATQSGGDAGPGSEFLRDDAKLSIIVVSDETDGSPRDWTEYLAYFQSLKTDIDNVVVHAISGDYPRGCGDASSTNKVYEMTVETGGLYLSVCAVDWASHLEALVEGSVYDLSSFQLSETPVPETIVVTVDGAPVTVGWTYDETGNSVDFDETHVPEGGSVIEITYALYGNCEQ
jgi:hypothetical protein